jgi:hypothetical protein
MAETAAVGIKQSDRRLGWPHPPSAPGWMAWVPQIAILWALVYGSVRLLWAIQGAPPSFGPLHFDLMYFTRWTAVVLCAAAAITALALRIAPWRWPLLAAAWAVCVAHLVACPLLLLDLVGGVLPGMGVPFSPVAFLSRSACFIEGILVGATAVAYRRRWRSECLFCGRTGFRERLAKTPRWAYWAAYSGVAGCMVRLCAQLAVGFGGLLRHAGGTRLVIEGLLFEAGFLLAGIVLPLALVYGWGRIIPDWAPMLGGRQVPRWLLQGPAFAISGLMTVYFGLTLVKLASDALTGSSGPAPGPALPLAFFWVAVPAYWIWGIGLGIAAISYYRMTRPKCRVCGL